MKMIMLYLFTLTLSFNIFAAENDARLDRPIKMLTIQSSDFSVNSENILLPSWSKPQPFYTNKDLKRLDSSNELLTEVIMYLLIVLIYGYIWYKTDKSIE